ncbi:hypothetical protein ACH5RR_013402 [Cinchona calisaya]|uniref:Uncharacterized protein n=1 Tax=Cinchona calisaya TaxID=153742 RepID=A0ABD3A3B3_9GENT
MIGVSNFENEESMTTRIEPIKILRKVNEKSNHPQDKAKKRATVKEMQDKAYPFLDYDVPYIFNHVLVANLIDFPEVNRLEEAGRIDNPNYYKFYRLIGILLKGALSSKVD